MVAAVIAGSIGYYIGDHHSRIQAAALGATAGFQVAAHRAWLTPAGVEVSIWLVQFGSQAGARSYILGTQQSDGAVAGNTVKLTVPGVADGMVIAAPSLDKVGDTVSRLLGDRGDVAILIDLYVPARLDNATATQVLQEQNARL